MTSAPDSPPDSAPDGQRLRTVAVVLAGGSGTRVGLAVPKQLLKVAGRTIIEHTVEALHGCPEVDEILVVMSAEFVPEVERLLRHDRLPKLTRVLPGGRDRNESTRAALAALGEAECNVLFHDAVRPLLSRRVVRDCVEALRTYEAVDVAVPSPDTIVRVDGSDDIADIPDRQWLRRGQTPQGFRLSTIRRAYELAVGSDHRATDDCGVVLHHLPHVPIHVVPGDEHNMKVTYPVDLFIVDKLFQLSSHQATPRSAQEHAEVLGGRTVVVLGGSYGIGADVVRQAEAAGCTVFSFGRSTTGTHVEEPGDIADALAQAHAATGRVDAVILTAAVLDKGKLVDMTDEAVLRQLQVNYLAPVIAARAAHPYLRETRGHLVLFTSSSYTRGRADYVMYSSTKAAVVNLTQALADEWSDDGISVNVINPERTRTPMRTRAFGAEPDHTLLSSSAVARTALDVLSGTTTGQVVDVRLSAGAPAADPRLVGAGPAPADAEVVAAEVAEVEDRAEVEAALEVGGGRPGPV